MIGTNQFVKANTNTFTSLRRESDEIVDLQKKHYEIIDTYKDSPQIQQTSLTELHKLNITLANYFDVLPDIVNGSSISKTTS